MRTDILPEKDIITAVQAALVNQAQKKAFIYKHFYEKKKSRFNALNDMYSYWDGPSDVKVGEKKLNYRDAVFYNSLMLELTKFFKLPEDKAIEVYKGLDLKMIKEYEIKLTEEG